MVATMKDSSVKMKFQDLETITGQMVSRILVTGLKIKWTVLVFLLGKTVRNTKVTLLTTKERVKVNLYGLMVVNILVHGKQENNTVLEPTLVKKAHLNKVNGKTAVKSAGLGTTALEMMILEMT